MKFKGLNIELKGLDETKGIVEAYANTYNIKDSDGDISAPGSFTKSVSENFNRIKVLQDHDQKIKLGVPREIDTKDPVGLLTVSQFNMHKAVSKDMFTDIQLEHQLGKSSELSIGYVVKERDKQNKSLIKQYALWEYSFMTTWGSNENSLVRSVKKLKAEDDPQHIVDLMVKMYNLDYSDQRLKELEYVLKSLASGPGNPTFETKPIETIDKYIKSLKTQ